MIGDVKLFILTLIPVLPLILTRIPTLIFILILLLPVLLLLLPVLLFFLSFFVLRLAQQVSMKNRNVFLFDGL